MPALWALFLLLGVSQCAVAGAAVLPALSWIPASASLAELGFAPGYTGSNCGTVDAYTLERMNIHVARVNLARQASIKCGCGAGLDGAHSCVDQLSRNLQLKLARILSSPVEYSRVAHPIAVATPCPQDMLRGCLSAEQVRATRREGRPSPGGPPWSACTCASSCS